MTMKIALAGPYPAGTLEQFQKLLPEQEFFAVDSQEAYDALTDVDLYHCPHLENTGARFSQ